MSLTIALEWADNEDFDDSETATFVVLGALPRKVPNVESVVKMGYRMKNGTHWTREIDVTFDNFSVEDPSGTIEQGQAALDVLTTALFAEHLRIIPTGTVLPRTSDGDEWWTDATIGWLGSDGVAVARMSFDVSSDVTSGTMAVSCTLRCVDPLT